MAILFFDGFDRFNITKTLDANYWSFQPGVPIEYQKYAFGGYTYSHDLDNTSFNTYNIVYLSESPNNATLPTGLFRSDYSYGTIVNGNYYPGFGSPQGFLALNNLDITDPYLLAPITYIQLSGFNLPTSGQSFLSARILGIETKHSNYVSIDKPGRFGHKHPLVAFCSGNTTGLILNIVKMTGNHLSHIENQKMTIGLEVEQTNGVSGSFDLNLGSDLNKYQIRSVYNPYVANYTLEDLGGLILTTAVTDAETTPLSPVSRWCHFQFGIIQTGSNPYLQIKLDDIDLLEIPNDDSIMDKDLWEDKIYISGFDFDNIRFFNRTYHPDMCPPYVQPLYMTHETHHRYYNQGSVTLFDDIVLSDGSGNPSTYLGSNAKVIPFTPGIERNLDNDGIFADGLQEWQSNISSSDRKILKSFDSDYSKIYTAKSGNITAVRYSTGNLILPDSSSRWRMSIEDAIGGIKVYNHSKKEFLDTSYINVIYTGLADPYQDQDVVFLDFENDGLYELAKNSLFNKEKNNVTNNIYKIGNNSLMCVSGGHILCSDNKELSIPTTQNIADQVTQRMGVGLTIEAWIYFSGENEYLTLWNKDFVNREIYSDGGETFNITASTGHISYNRFYHAGNTILYSGYLTLNYPTGMNLNEWYHVAFISQSGYGNAICFLNGVSGTSYSYYSDGGAGFFGQNGSYSGNYTNKLWNWSDSSSYFSKNFIAYTTQSSTSYYVPLKINGNGYIDNYRATTGVRYLQNFDPPLEIYSIRHSYLPIGDIKTVTKTRYGKPDQFYVLNNPSTNSPWTTGIIASPSGILLGVKKI